MKESWKEGRLRGCEEWEKAGEAAEKRRRGRRKVERRKKKEDEDLLLLRGYTNNIGTSRVNCRPRSRISAASCTALYTHIFRRRSYKLIFNLYAGSRMARGDSSTK